jgi:putative hydrolase of the HAD superfamily
LKTYQHIFFDLDHTLWDYDRNVTESLSELYHHYDLLGLGIPTFQNFFDSFLHINYQLWDDYNVGRIDKVNLRKTRFPRIFSHAGGMADAIPAEFEEDFMNSSKSHVSLYFEVGLFQNKYQLHVITDDESQAKINSVGSHLLDLVVTSETTGHKA